MAIFKEITPGQTGNPAAHGNYLRLLKHYYVSF